MAVSLTRQPLPAVSLGALCLVLAFGCQVGVITHPDFNAPDVDAGMMEVDTQAMFEMTVQPLLEMRCGACHSSGGPGPNFLETDPTAYASVLGYQSLASGANLVVVGEPGTSILLTKGNHDGPAWNAAQYDTIAAWIAAEAGGGPEDAGMPPPPDDPVESPAITVALGASNRIPLDLLGLSGSAIQFTAEEVGLGLRLDNVELIAGAAGVAISHPRFVMYDSAGAPTLDDDRYPDTNLRLSSGETGSLSDGAVLLVGYDATGTLSMQFGSASTMQ